MYLCMRVVPLLAPWFPEATTRRWGDVGLCLLAASFSATTTASSSQHKFFCVGMQESVRRSLFALRVAQPGRKFAFYHSFGRPTITFCVKGRSDKLKICILPQFWTSDTHEVTRGSPRQITNLRFTTVLSVRSARSDERVVKSKGALPAPWREKDRF